MAPVILSNKARAKFRAQSQIHQEIFGSTQVTGCLERAMGCDHPHGDEEIGILSQRTSTFGEPGSPTRVREIRPANQTIDIFQAFGVFQYPLSGIEIWLSTVPDLTIGIIESLVVFTGDHRAVGKQTRPAVADVCPKPVQEAVVHIGNAVPSSEMAQTGSPSSSFLMRRR